jgi:thiamine biosynthesis lipoprotein
MQLPNGVRTSDVDAKVRSLWSADTRVHHNSALPALNYKELAGGWRAAQFRAFAEPWELLFPPESTAVTTAIASLAAQEAWRIEHKFSVYLADSVIGRIQLSRGSEFEVDTETAALIEFGQHCYEASDGLIDITFGARARGMRRLDCDADGYTLSAQRPPVGGFDKLRWRRPYLLLPQGMELDFGWFLKFYAVDRIFEQLAVATSALFLIQVPGTLRAPRREAPQAWDVALDRTGAHAPVMTDFVSGGLVTSRVIDVVSPRSASPVPGAPRSVTVASRTCMDAGVVARLALLQGADAADFLHLQGRRHWIVK